MVISMPGSNIQLWNGFRRGVWFPVGLLITITTH